jgi:TetR/AcrR family transcriptional repressor of nem operon
MARPRTFAEDEVIAAARDRFWSTGYAGTSVDDLTAATGLGRGSLYGAFGDKHALFLRALDSYCADTGADVDAQLAGPDADSDVGAYDRLVRHIRTVADRTAADRTRRGCLLAKTAAEFGGQDKDVARRVKRALDHYQDRLAATIAAAQRAGELDPSADPDTLAGLVLAVLRGMEAMGKAGASPAAIRAIAAQAIALLPAA